MSWQCGEDSVTKTNPGVAPRDPAGSTGDGHSPDQCVPRLLRRSGENGYTIYFIEEGTVDVLGDAGESIATLGPGDTFGEIALLVTGKRTATVKALTHLRALSVFEPDFKRVLRKAPDLERALRRLGGERLSQS